MWTSRLLLHWELQLGKWSVGCFVLFFSSVMLPSEISKLSADSPVERVSWYLETSPPSWLHPRDGSPSLTLLPHFCLLYFFLPPFKENGLISGSLVSSASIQKLFCGSCSAFKWSFDDCGEDSGLPILFLCHLRTALALLFYLFSSLYCVLKMENKCSFSEWYIRL